METDKRRKHTHEIVHTKNVNIIRPHV